MPDKQVAEQVEEMLRSSGWGYVAEGIEKKKNDLNRKWWKADPKELDEIVTQRRAIEELEKLIKNLTYTD